LESCEICQRQAPKTWPTTRNRKACHRCTRDAADCPHCLRIILPGDGVTRYDRDCYCYECSRDKKWCRRCSYPIFAGEGDYCADCPPRVFCGICQKDCSDRFFRHEELGERCPACCTCKECEAVGQDVVEGKCSGCRCGPVKDLHDGLALFPAAYEFLRDVMELTIVKMPELRVSLEAPDCQVRQYPGGLYSGNWVGICCSSGWIWLKSGLSEPVSVFVLVHELTHTWQNENCVLHPGELREGLAVWIEYKCALYLNYPEFAQSIRTNRCPIYGGGLRTCLLWEEAVGWRQLLQDVRLAHDFPDWLKRGWFRGQAA